MTTLPPPNAGTRKNCVGMPLSITDTNVWLFCQGVGCGGRQMVAHGNNSQYLTRAMVVKCAIAMGWSVAPRFLCVNCRSHAEIQAAIRRSGDLATQIDAGKCWSCTRAQQCETPRTRDNYPEKGCHKWTCK